MATAPIFRDPQEAFSDAIAQGRLSVKGSDPTYAGQYMYMGTHSGVDMFKHIDTRKYLPPPAGA